MVNNILKTLEERAKKELELILKQEQEELLGLKNEFAKRSQEKKEEEKKLLEEKKQKELSLLSQKLSFRFNLETQFQKASDLNEVYQNVIDRLASLKEAEMEKFLKKMLSFLPKEEGVIVAGKKTMPFLKKIAGEGRKVQEGLEEEGFLFKAPGVEIDFRFSSILLELKEKIEPELARIIYA